jgi:Aspartyl protease/PDZ domain
LKNSKIALNVSLKTPILKPFALFVASGTILLNLILPALRSYAQDGASPLAVKAAPAAVKEGTGKPGEGAARGVTVPAANGVELKAMINGQGPFDALFDTGSRNLMSASLAKRLGLKLEGSGTLSGLGGSVAAQGAFVDTVKIGGMTMARQWFVVFDPPVAKDKDFAIIGDQLLRNLAITVDFERQQITFYDEQHFRYLGNGVPVPVHMIGDGVVAEGSVDEIAGLFGIDTGDMYSLLLFAPFVGQHDLIKRFGAKIHGYAGEGWGGPDTGFYTRATKLQLGAASVHRPITVLSTDEQGAGAASSVAGNIGLQILRQFTVTFDCPHGKMYLEKNSSYGKPDIFNRAGLLLDLDPDHLEIETVIPGSPAAEAGLAEEDVITQIDGSPPTDDSIQSAFTQPVGTVVHLTVLHAGAFRSVALTLKDVL